MRNVDEADDDAALIERFLNGDPRSFEILMERYYVRIGRLAAHVLGDPLAAEDIAQEVFMRAYRGLAQYRGDAALLTWLSRITVNLCVTTLRRQRAGVAFGRSAMHTVPGADARGGLELREQQVAVREAVDSLPIAYRLVIVLSEVEGLAYREIADLLGIPIGTVKSRINAAKHLLRARLLPLLPGRPGPPA